jgi:antirestriction protein ArdC
VRHGGNRPFYTTAGDYIQMPELRQFVAADRYYSTLAHEHLHNADPRIMPHDRDWRLAAALQPGGNSA